MVHLLVDRHAECWASDILASSQVLKHVHQLAESLEQLQLDALWCHFYSRTMAADICKSIECISIVGECSGVMFVYPAWGRGTSFPHLPLPSPFTSSSFALFYFFFLFSFALFIFFYSPSLPFLPESSHSCFQAGDRRRRPNLDLVCFVADALMRQQAKTVMLMSCIVACHHQHWTCLTRCWNWILRDVSAPKVHWVAHGCAAPVLGLCFHTSGFCILSLLSSLYLLDM